MLNAAGDAAVITVQPATGPSDAATTRLLDTIRADSRRGVLVTGTEAIYADASQRLADQLWLVIAFVVAVSLLILTALLRAPVNALKAAVLNLLSVAAAYGVVTAVFQTNAGAHIMGLPHGVPVSTWAPMLMFAVLFGLSMDYEVFLLSRVREAWLVSGDARDAVGRRLGSTARVISSAAAIMIAVFLGLATDPNVMVKAEPGKRHFVYRSRNARRMRRTAASSPGVTAPRRWSRRWYATARVSSGRVKEGSLLSPDE